MESKKKYKWKQKLIKVYITITMPDGKLGGQTRFTPRIYTLHHRPCGSNLASNNNKTKNKKNFHSFVFR